MFYISGNSVRTAVDFPIKMVRAKLRLEPREVTNAKYGKNTEGNSTWLGVWLLWHMARQHVARGSSHRWAGIFSVFRFFGDSEDSDSLLQKGLVPLKAGP